MRQILRAAPLALTEQHHPLARGCTQKKAASIPRTITGDGPPRMAKRPTGSGGEPSSPNCGVSAGGKARQLLLFCALAPKTPSQFLVTCRLLQPVQCALPCGPATGHAGGEQVAPSGSLPIEHFTCAKYTGHCGCHKVLV